MSGLNAGAPASADALCASCADHFAATRRHLDALGVRYEVTKTLVRGLDYYTRTTFEFVPAGAGGQQSALGGGGRYDGLVELLGGRPTAGIGFGIGLDRVAAALGTGGVDGQLATGKVTAAIVGADKADTLTRLRLATDLRAAGIAAHAELQPHSLSRQLERAARMDAHFAVICGDELTAGQVQLRDLQAGTQRPVNVADLARELLRADAGHRHGSSG
ncbi:MAG TPA: ATP phosphoribosyltransferase regulatory subunit [Candidatus Limnocylindria bacterium]|nr:ATP phosphoribosyltransferase regulatory subunit [Candidatus Limnocylindria bacterium]